MVLGCDNWGHSSPATRTTPNYTRQPYPRTLKTPIPNTAGSPAAAERAGSWPIQDFARLQGPTLSNNYSFGLRRHAVCHLLDLMGRRFFFLVCVCVVMQVNRRMSRMRSPSRPCCSVDAARYGLGAFSGEWFYPNGHSAGEMRCTHILGHVCACGWYI